MCGYGRFLQQHLSVISAGGAAQHTTVRPTLRCPEHCKQVVLSACQKDHLPAHFSSADTLFWQLRVTCHRRKYIVHLCELAGDIGPVC